MRCVVARLPSCQSRCQSYSVKMFKLRWEDEAKLSLWSRIEKKHHESELWEQQPDAEASCVFRESCILPCSFQTGNDVVIHWIQVATGNYIHSYYHNQDQLARQDQRFKGRTSLFKDQIFRGNTSLQLTGVEVQDQGRYKCFTSTIRGNKESSINLKVDAPVHKVNIQQVENRITCSSEGIYPEPELTWSTKPPSALTFENTTTVQQTDQQLYNIKSSLILSDSVTDLVYSCKVSTDRNWRRATLFKPTSLNVSDTEATIFCTSSNTPLLGLVWRFNSQIILNRIRDDASFTVSEGWRQQVKGVSGSGSLTLQDLSSNQEGTYTCELIDDEETYVTNIMVKIQETHHSHEQALSSRGEEKLGQILGFMWMVLCLDQLG